MESFRQSHANGPRFQISATAAFPQWLAEQQVSLAISTYQSGKMFLVGTGPTGELSVFERSFNRCMGLWSDGQTIWLASAFQLWRLQNVLSAGQIDDGYDRLFVPSVGYTTGDVDAHDVAVDAQGRVVFACTLLSCLATTSETYSLQVLWRPPFISKLAAQDRCHLNGLAMQGGRPRFVTVCGLTDTPEGWRGCRVNGGCIMEVPDGNAVVDELSMPHSPRVYRDELWVLNSGEGYLGRVDVAQGKFEPVLLCPGYARGLAFWKDYAVFGVSKPRQSTFHGLPLDENLKRRNIEPLCGVQVADLNVGKIMHSLNIEGPTAELYDVVVLPNAKRPKALGFKTDEIRQNFWVDCDGHVQRWTARTP